MMEGRGWHRAAKEHGARIVPYMAPNKVYLHQVFTTCFAEFDTIEEARDFRAYADRNLPYWDYDPVATIDTHDPHAIDRWRGLVVADADKPL